MASKKITEGTRITATKDGEKISGSVVQSPIGNGDWYLDGPGRHLHDLEANGYTIAVASTSS
ncbi:hypothetical protein B7R22_17275 [Subtercola boreus]|uniref:Uncharacterized protein n=1 Tax=Subtercola boreus TaxID=120213 RepID=A0A3E0VRE8_9MICO|nr:hypothetical protein [Subtercola boreus]RFA12179.1 hypothetical protein B7R22_17275 [Subtercola boreus]